MKTKKITLFCLLSSAILSFYSTNFVNAQSDYIYSVKGGTVNSTTANPSSAIMLIGGAEVGASWGDNATEWFLQHADGGDYLVIRYGSPGGQASWAWSNWSHLLSSAAEIAINNIEAANDPAVEQIILDAEAIFFAGGDQDNYENNWKNTKVEDAINHAINVKGVPVSGTSAGMAILGDSYYAPSGSAVLGSQILDNPYHSYTSDIFHDDFLNVPYLNNVITETHADRVLSGENRYSRAFGFLARVYADNGGQLPSYAIICEEATHVCIDGNGIATVYGNGASDGAAAYFLQTNGVGPETIQAGSELVWYNNGEAVKAYHIEGETTGSGSFDLKDWYTASGGDWEDWYTTGGYAGFNYTGGSCSGCTGANPPNGGTTCYVPGGLSSSNLTTTTADLSWNFTGAISYDLKYKSITESIWNEVNLTTNTYSLTNLTLGTTYEFQVRGNCAELSSDFSSSATFTTLLDDITYCASQGNVTSYAWIDRIEVGDLINASGVNNGYYDFTAMSANLVAGNQYNVSLTPGFSGSSYTEHWEMWIDLNHDGDFDDLNENVYSASSSSTVNGTITIPAETAETITRMRISMKYGGSATPCETFTYGEVEDYTVIISEGLPPQNQDPVAVINGPYNGTENVDVSFSSSGSNDSDGNIISYLWDFGDGSTSSQANPTHTYSTANVYNVSLTVTDNDNATNSTQTTATIVADNPGGDVELAYSTFEDGWGVWTDGGADCFLYTSGTYSYEGNNSAGIQDNSGVASSFYLTNGIDVHNPGFVQIDVEFHYYAYSMDNSSEDFWVQYYDGSTWHTVATYARSIDFENDVFYSTTVSIDELDYNFPTGMKVRFMCDASGNKDDVYIDNIRITGKTTRTAALAQPAVKAKTLTVKELFMEEEEIKLYPNPAKNELNIMVPYENVKVKFIALSGVVVKEMQIFEKEENINIADLKSGIYILLIESNNGSFTKRFIKQ